MIKLLYILPFITFAQFDLTSEMYRILIQENHSLGIGNACDEDYMYVEVFGDLDMNFNRIEILRSKITVYGDIVNQGNITYLCDDSILEVLGSTLTTTNTDFSNLRVYPNPVIDELFILGIDIEYIVLYDLNGKILKKYKTAGNSHTIEMSNIRSGLYILTLNNNINKKIIKA